MLWTSSQKQSLAGEPENKDKGRDIKAKVDMDAESCNKQPLRISWELREETDVLMFTLM